MSLIDALGLVLTVFGGILFLRKRTEGSDETQEDSGKYPFGRSGPSVVDLERFSSGDSEGVTE